MDNERNHTVIDGMNYKDYFEDSGEKHHRHGTSDHEGHGDKGHGKHHYYEPAHVGVKGGKAVEGDYVPFSLYVDKPNDLPIKVTLTDAFGTGKHPATPGEDFKDKFFVYDHESKDYVKAKGNMIVIPPKEYAVDFYVKTKDDYDIEPKEKFAVKIEWVKYLYNEYGTPDPKFDPYEEAVGRIIDNDCATVSVEGGKGKEGEYIAFTLNVDKPNDLDIKVTLQDAFGTGKHPAFPGEDFKEKYFVYDHETYDYVVAKKNMVTIPAGESSATFYVKAKDDYVVEPKEKFGVQIKKVKYIDNEYKLNEPKFDPYEVAKGVINDDDRAHIKVEGGMAVEGDYVPFILYVDQPIELPVKVTLKDPKGFGKHAATAGEDFKAKYFTLDYETNEYVPVKNNMVEIPAYEFAQVVFVKTKDDYQIEPQEQFSVKIEWAEYLYNEYGYKEPKFDKKDKAVGVIKDNDCATVVVKGGLAEEGEYIPFRLHVDKPIGLDIKVTLSKAFGIDEYPATPGEDFIPKYFVFDHYTKEYVKVKGDMVVLPANEKWVDFYVKSKDDYDKEYDETFGVKIEGAEYLYNDYKFLEPKFDPDMRAVGIIRDNDYDRHHDHDHHGEHHGKGEHGGKGEHHGKGEHGGKGEHHGKGEHGGKGEHHGKGEHGGKGEHHGKGEHGGKGEHHGEDDGHSVHYHYYYSSDYNHEDKHGKGEHFGDDHKGDGHDHSVHYHYYYGPYSENENHGHGGEHGGKNDHGDKHDGGDKHDHDDKSYFYDQYYNYDNYQYNDHKHDFNPESKYGFDHYGYDLEPHFNQHGFDDPNFWSYQRDQHHSFKDAWVKYQITHGDYDYRHVDGSGNNKYDHSKGAAEINLSREAPNGYLDPDYLEDGYTPAGDATRPSAREISNEIFSQVETMPNADNASAMFWLWGQFIDHDLDLTDATDEHFDIKIPQGDIYFDPNGDGDKIMELTRSKYDESTGHDGIPREQVNHITSYLDASMVYGSDHERSSYLRSYEDGKMKTSEYDLLPYNEAGLPNAGGTDSSLFIAGDVRANEQVGLTAMHTLWVREHNHWCDKIKSWYPDMCDEDIYQRAKMMVECEIQNITYNEFLPILLGKEAMPNYDGYNSEVNPDVANVFSTAAYRLGHSMVSSTIFRLDENGETIEAGNLALRDAFFSPQTLADQHEIASILRGFAGSKSEAIDSHVVDELRNFLFGEPGSGGFDLVALNIQRGRDHGLPDYNSVREAYGLTKITAFSDITNDPVLASKLEALYGDVNNIDVWVGGLCEDAYGDSMLGETFHNIVADQFMRMRDGDRHWFEDRLPEDVLHLVKDTTLSDVIVRNTDVKYMQSDAMINYDRIYGTDGDDDLQGDQFNDLVVALNGKDLIEGYDGNDQIHGGKGKDNIHGGKGNDVIHGNGGKDMYVFHKHSGHDVIKDFKPGKDKIDVKDYHLNEADLFLETYKVGKDTVISLSPDSKITLENISPIDLQYTDFIV